MEVFVTSLEFVNHVLDRLADTLPGVATSTLQSFLLAAGLLLIELFFIGWQHSSVRRLCSAGDTAFTDVLSALLTLSNFSLYLGTLMLFGILYAIQSSFKSRIDWGLLNYIQSPELAFFIYLVFLDFSNYWIHRLCHQVPALWEIHKYHHSASEMTMFTALRDHPMERAIVHFINAPIACILGVPPTQYLAIHFLLQSLGFLKHSNLRSDWGWIGNWLIQSPVAHRFHHGIETRYHNSNYATIFQFWDVIFKTAHKPKPNEDISIEIGVFDLRGSTFKQEILSCAKSFYKTLSKDAAHLVARALNYKISRK